METRLGDIIDDFCIKCKRITNHAVVSMLGPVAAKVRCRTCYSDHDYRHEQAPPPKIDPRKAAALSEAQEKLNSSAVAVAPAEDLEDQGHAEDQLAETANPESIQSEPAEISLSARPKVKRAPK